MYIIRADGNEKIGVGHLMRCLTIADELGDKEGVLFVCANEDCARLPKEGGYHTRVLYKDYKDMEGELCLWENIAGGKKENHIILVDSYFATDAYLKELQKFGRTAVLEDGGERVYPAHMVINYNVYADKNKYRKRYQNKNTRCYVGGKYIPLRPRFSNSEYEVREKVRNILITTGGGDSDNIAGKILKQIYREEPAADRINYHLVVGKYNPHYEELQKWTSRPGVTIHRDVQDMAALMIKCDLAITAGGTTIYELAAVGVPFICFSYADNQEALTEYIGKNQIAAYAGAFHKEPEKVLQKIGSLFREMCEESSFEKRNRCYEKEKRMVDGKGAKRLAAVLKSFKKQSISYWLAALLLFGALAGIAFWPRAISNPQNYQIVCLGDSIFGQVRDDTSITAFLSDYLYEEDLAGGVTIFNGAFGGSNLSRLDESRSLGNTTDGLSMAALSLSIANCDFAVQQDVNYKNYGNGTEYFAETIKILSEIDFEKTKILLISHGVNDYFSGVPLSNPENPYDTYSFEGALRTTLKSLKEKLPDMRIVLITPTYSWQLHLLKTCEEWDSGYGTLEDYVNLEMALAKEYEVEIIDNFHNLYPHDKWEDWQIYTTDGVHPNEAGRQAIAENIAEYFRKNK